MKIIPTGYGVIWFSLYLVSTAILFAVLTTGCALLPNTVSPVIEHVSHLTQHAPFTSHPTDYGYNQVALQAHWNVTRNTFVEVSEGYNLGTLNTHGQACGALYGGREVFTAKIGYTFHVKP